MPTIIDRAIYGVQGLVSAGLVKLSYDTSQLSYFADLFFDKYFLPCKSGVTSQKICTLIEHVEVGYTKVIENTPLLHQSADLLFPSSISYLVSGDYVSKGAILLFGFLAADSLHRTFARTTDKNEIGFFDRLTFSAGFLGFGVYCVASAYFGSLMFPALDTHKYMIVPCITNVSKTTTCLNVQKIWTKLEDLVGKSCSLFREYNNLESMNLNLEDCDNLLNYTDYRAEFKALAVALPILFGVLSLKNWHSLVSRRKINEEG